MTSPWVDGGRPRPAGTTSGSTSSSGSAPRPRGAGTANAQELAAQFSAQVELSMLQSLGQLSGDEGAGDDGADGVDGGGDASGADLGLGAGLQQAQLLASLATGFRRQGMGEAQVQAQLAALGGALTGAGAGSEAALSQSLLALGGAVDGTGAGVGTSGSTTPPASASPDARANARIVAQVAREQGVDPVLAVAMMLVESGGNAGAVGDGGTSFGLFQLHRGGMLTAAGLDPQQAFDARTNATVALRSLANEWAKGHARRSPGEIAAASQRPADPAGYAARVNAALDRARTLCV